MAVTGTHQEISVPEVVESLTSASRVLFVPGYGLAVANAQHSIAELTKMLKKKGVEVRGPGGRGGSGGMACVAAGRRERRNRCVDSPARLALTTTHTHTHTTPATPLPPHTHTHAPG
jgi:hypothetical protein